MDRRKRIWIWLSALLVALIVFLVIGAWVDHRHGSNKSQVSTLNEPDGPLAFSDPKNLPDILLDRQLSDFSLNMSGFITQQFGGGVKSYGLAQNAIVQDSGIITFKIKLLPGGQEFGVTLDRISDYQKLTIKVPSYNYQQTLAVY